MNNQDELAMRVEQVREDYGDELFDTILDEAGRRAEERLSQAQFGTKKQMVSDMLSRQGVDFEQTNNDPVFHDWLKVYDPQTGVQRQAKLSGSFENGDLNTVASMFTEFKNDGGNVAAPQGNHAMAAQFGNQGSSSKPLRQQHHDLMRLKNRAQQRGDMDAANHISQQMNAIIQQMQQGGAR